VAERLIAVARKGAGCDNIDLDTCTNADILVFNSPHGLKHSTALGALSLLLCAGRNMLVLDRLVREGRWDERIDYVGADYLRHTLGVVGPGRIGSELIRLLSPFEMRVLAYDPHLTQESARAIGIESVPLPTLMRESDFVCITCSLTPETTNLLNGEMLALMKPTAILVNVARGAVVDQKALTEVLQQGRIAGAGLDVFVDEPLPANDPLTRLENVVLSPHTASSSRDMGRLTTRDTVEGLVKIAHGAIPDNVVNPEVLDRPGFQAKLARWAQRSGARAGS
jgi:phosphoglycerate dehydrogenase-like enzyme